ncbi:hypothetical protein ONS95_011581 [Cadophora gregata]|uniref:uncharacterized protein n=1 Tax=Cadophora gregata TaxID=51156 RepID=UPI0026DC235E|nr:uncharacterized protein ONS95_011581 [Cadophora gregata]KAK0120175.1 hypothetical protein ONS95_011581 [Cadophora gregata]KAK0121203.1 hypothetical protein ONS96_011382 [Cadophora gregata f. sp. sojae]
MENISKPITLECGLTLPNRLVKAAMAENLAGQNSLPNSKHLLAAYNKWSQGGWGLVLTGNVMVDSAYRGISCDVVIDSSIPKEKVISAWKGWAEACSMNGTKAIVQLNHSGRQTPWRTGIAPSAIPLDFGRGILPYIVNTLVFGTPREMSIEDIQNVVQMFREAACLAAEAGFAGIEIHAAHGYLLASFLSPISNHRTDAYGGSESGRARIVVEVIRAIRVAVPPSFCVGIKLNSGDHQSDSSMSQCISQISSIIEAGVDFLEISGGTFENPSFSTGSTASDAAQHPQKNGREGFFLDFASAIRAKFPRVPLIVTGGFRTRRAMEAAVRDSSCDMIGLARPAVMNPSLPKDIILNSQVQVQHAVACVKAIEESRFSKWAGIKAIGVGAETGWYTKRIYELGDQLP